VHFQADGQIWRFTFFDSLAPIPLPNPELALAARLSVLARELGQGNENNHAYRLEIWQPMAVVVALDTERPASTASIASCKSRRVGSGRDLPKSVYQSSMRPR
jgi:hypothetical protein